MSSPTGVLAPPSPAPVMPSACASHGCGGGPPRRPPPRFTGRVRVNGTEIDPDAIAREIQHHPAADAEAAWREAARALAVRELLLQEARRLDIAAEPEEDEAGRVEAEDDALVRALLEARIETRPPDEVACSRYYDANTHRFRTSELFEVAHILIEPEGDDPRAGELARHRAAEIAASLGDDASAFARAARAYSACPSAQQDGSLGQVRRGELVKEIHDALEAMAVGTTSHAPVQSRFGWHILRLQRRIPGRVLPFEMVKDRIADMLEARSWTVACGRYVAALARSATVEGIEIGPDV